MAIVIERLEGLLNGYVVALVRHCENKLTVSVCGDEEVLRALIGQECIVEMDYERLITWREISVFEDSQSCIRQSAEHENVISVIGRVHNITQMNEVDSVVDLYIQNGPEFLALSSSELGGVRPEIGKALEVSVEGLRFYPVNY